jgi:hypothetical protein
MLRPDGSLEVFNRGRVGEALSGRRFGVDRGGVARGCRAVSAEMQRAGIWTRANLAWS